METEFNSRVRHHYRAENLIASIDAALVLSGLDPHKVRPADLAPVDEFHTAGRLSTVRALDLAGFSPGSHILDAGAGIGGTARHLAAEHGMRVTGVDLTPEYVAAATTLTRRMGLSSQCGFVEGSVLDLPFEDRKFDGALTFHVGMNVEDRRGFYSEVARVLKPGAKFCLFDVMAGEVAGLEFPVPWATEPETSFLYTPAQTTEFLREAGFEIEAEESFRDPARAFFKAAFKRAADGPPPLGLHLITGKESPAKFQNYVDALEAGQIDPVIMVAKLVG